MLSTAMGCIMVAGSAFKGAPQIARILQARSSRGLAPAALYGDGLVYASKVAYHARQGYPLSAWGELLLLLAQNVACIGLMHAFRPGESGVQRWRRGLSDAAGFATIWWSLARLPGRFLPLVSAATAPLLLASYGAQAVTNWRRRSTGELAALTVLLRWAGSLLRVGTTLTQLSGDVAVLINHLIGVAGCTVLLAQLWWWRPRAPAATSGTPPEGLPSAEALARAPWPPSPGLRVASTKAAAAALAWESLGGFGGGGQSERSLRAAFEALDRDGSGAISLDELEAAIRSAGEGEGGVEGEVEGEVARGMLAFADEDGNGTIDFAEYRQIMEASHPQSLVARYLRRYG